MKLLIKLIFAAALLTPGVVQAKNDDVRAFVQDNQHLIIWDLLHLISLPNNAENPEDILKNAKFIQNLYRENGFETEIWEAPGGPVSFFAEKSYPGATKTVVFYIHFDGQPVDETRWATPPYQATLKNGRLEDDAEVIDFLNYQGELSENWRIYGRSASDDKAPVVALIYALKALEAAGITPSVNIKVFMDGAEEAGSPNLQALIEKYQDKLAGDAWLFLDGPQDQRGNPRVVLGVRGVTGFGLTTYGPVRGLHSGHYGNFSPNPSLRLAHLLSSMRNEDGHVLIDGFYDEVRASGAVEEALIAAIPSGDGLIMEDAGISDREYPDLRYEETHLIPALNIRGLQAGGVGDKARNIIDSQATASIGIRMAPDMTIAETEKVIEDHIIGQGYHIVRVDPTLEQRLQYPKIAKVTWGESGYPAVRTSPDDPFIQRLIEIMQTETDGETLIYPTLGGSLPLAHIVLPLDAPFAILPIANQDNSQHAPNENIRLGHLYRGIELIAAVLAGIGSD